MTWPVKTYKLSIWMLLLNQRNQLIKGVGVVQPAVEAEKGQRLVYGSWSRLLRRRLIETVELFGGDVAPGDRNLQ